MQSCYRMSIPENYEDYLWSLWTNHQLLSCWSSNHTPCTDLDWSWNAKTGSHFCKCMDEPASLLAIHIVICFSSKTFHGWQFNRDCKCQQILMKHVRQWNQGYIHTIFWKLTNLCNHHMKVNKLWTTSVPAAYEHVPWQQDQ